MTTTTTQTPTEEKSPKLASKLPLQAEEVKERLETLGEQVTGFIKANPGLSLAGGVALGYLIARLARKVG